MNELIQIYQKADNKIGVISFTDHNKINNEAYKLINSRNNISIIPGIEVDIWLTSEAKDSKHIIFYFSEKWLSEINKLKRTIGFFAGHQTVVYEEFVLYLTSNKINSAISPHVVLLSCNLNDSNKDSLKRCNILSIL